MSDNEQDVEERVRRRAYGLWEEAGRPEGRGNEFWREAWDEITSGSQRASSCTTSIAELPPNNQQSKSAQPTS